MTLEEYCQIPESRRNRICRKIAHRLRFPLAIVHQLMDSMVERWVLYDSVWNDEYTKLAIEYLDVYNELTDGHREDK